MAKDRVNEKLAKLTELRDEQNSRIVNALVKAVNESHSIVARDEKTLVEITQTSNQQDLITVKGHDLQVLKLFLAAAYDCDFKVKLETGTQPRVVMECPDELVEAVMSGNSSPFKQLTEKLNAKEKIREATGGFIGTKEDGGMQLSVPTELLDFCEQHFAVQFKAAIEDNIKPLKLLRSKKGIYQEFERLGKHIDDIKVDETAIEALPNKMERAGVPKAERDIFFRAIEDHLALRPLYRKLALLEPGTQMIPVSTKQNITEETRAVS